MSHRPIADHAMLSDSHSAALVDTGGSIEWWCVPRFDSPSVFGRLLDDRAGHFAIRPAGEAMVRRAYEDGSLVLTSVFETAGGTIELTDALAMAPGARGHDLGKSSPHVLVRRVRCVGGIVEMSLDYAPRFEYGLTSPLLKLVEGGVVARGGSVSLLLSSPMPLSIDGPNALATFRLHVGDEACFAVEYASSWEPPPSARSQDDICHTVEDTVEAWRSWGAEHQRYEGPYGDLVMHSGRVLQGLTYAPTGAMVAAPTTSLPESIGGARNWDYRFSWVRDASLTLDALWVAACPDEAHVFFDYLTTAVSSFRSRGRLQIMFGIRGERDLSERPVPWLEGWRKSSPVRVGNGAWDQRQNDVYGEMLNAAHRLQEQVANLGDVEKAFLVGLADTAARLWEEPDQGIWETRDAPRHHLYSKLMCWVALDRAIEMAPEIGATNRADDWRAVREEIRGAILSRGWSEGARAFTQSFDSDDLDASALVIPIVGFLPADDPRVLSTIEAIDRELTDEHGLVFRYRTPDGLGGDEGAFLLCTFWLAEALALAGRIDRARQVFERAIGFVNDVGLLSEEVDPRTGELIGNFPQAFSHVGLVNAAWSIGRAELEAE